MQSVPTHSFGLVGGTRDALTAIGTVGTTGLASARTFAGLMSGGVGNLAPLGIAGEGILDGAGGVGGLTDLLGKQIAVQKEMQAFTIETNVIKTRHDSRMAAIRNMRP